MTGVKAEQQEVDQLDPQSEHSSVKNNKQCSKCHFLNHETAQNTSNFQITLNHKLDDVLINKMPDW